MTQKKKPTSAAMVEAHNRIDEAQAQIAVQARSSLNRLRLRERILMDPRSVPDHMTQIWGTEGWTRAEVIESVCRMVEGGTGFHDALCYLQANMGRMPSPGTFLRWCKEDTVAGARFKNAQQTRAFLLADAATEAAIQSNEDTAKSDAVLIKQLQWHASKLNIEDFGDQKGNNQGPSDESRLTLEEVNSRLKALLSDPRLTPVLPEIIDGEVIQALGLQSPPVQNQE